MDSGFKNAILPDDGVGMALKLGCYGQLTWKIDVH